MITVSVLMACHNRKAQTLACLTSLFAQQLSEISLHVWLLDDASSDGTADSIRQQFPAVHLLQGSGQMFWTKGMRYCWQQALQTPSDFYLWLNDDVILTVDAIQRLVDCYQQLAKSQPSKTESSKPHAQIGTVVGTLQDPTSQRWSYGGRRSPNPWFPLSISGVVPPDPSEALPCDYANGNLCLIPASAVATVGILSEQFTHKMGDFDYSFRLRQAGFQQYIAPGCFGSCAVHPVAGSIKDATIPLKVRLMWMDKPANRPALGEWLLFIRWYGGPFWPLLYAKAIVGRWFPRLWLLLNQRRV